MRRTRGLSVDPATLQDVRDFNAMVFLKVAFTVRIPDVEDRSVRIPDTFLHLLQSTNY